MTPSRTLVLAMLLAGTTAGAALATTTSLATLSIRNADGQALNWNEDLPFAFGDAVNFDLIDTPGIETPEAGTFVSLVGKAGYPMLWASGDTTLKYTLIGRKPGGPGWIGSPQGGLMGEDGNVHYSDVGAELFSTWKIGSSIYTRGNTAGMGGVNFFYELREEADEDINGNGVTGELLSIDNWSGPMAEGQPLRIAFGHVFNNGHSVLAFFDNGRGETTYDDMIVRIDVVPLPAPLALMAGALAALAAFGWRRKRLTA